LLFVTHPAGHNLLLDSVGHHRADLLQLAVDVLDRLVSLDDDVRTDARASSTREP